MDALAGVSELKSREETVGVPGRGLAGNIKREWADDKLRTL